MNINAVQASFTLDAVGLVPVNPKWGATSARLTLVVTPKNLVIGFDKNSASLTEKSQKLLKRLSPWLESIGGLKVAGYVQAAGSTSNDASLSLDRAQSVVDFMQTNGVDTSIQAKGLKRKEVKACRRFENRCAVVSIVG